MASRTWARSFIPFLVAGCASSPEDGSTGSDWMRSTGFAERSSWPSAVAHLSRTEMGTSRGLRSVLEAIDGVEVRVPRGTGWGVHAQRSNGSRCELQVALNGVTVLRERSGGDWTVDILTSVEDLDGVEVHVGTESPLRDPSGCGQVLLWSERSEVRGEAPFVGTVEGGLSGPVGMLEQVGQIRLDPGGLLTAPDQDGLFAFPPVLPGPYVVTVMAGVREVVRREIWVFAFEETWVGVGLAGSA